MIVVILCGHHKNEIFFFFGRDAGSWCWDWHVKLTNFSLKSIFKYAVADIFSSVLYISMTYNDTNSKSLLAQLMGISLCFQWIHSGFKSLSPNYQIIKMAYNGNNGCDIARLS